ncbi:DUF1714-domain-containing protein [Ascobolus immersus RN42]|uniref:histone acetyltransferase n=1 Tax=Ascobolus immersus RN42 TaxID=1160509 RepID=A0A3N4HWH5_ASCIM|nr:DUF1714-domain-containing protein [Ascobolus immersus RN42]
MASTTQETPLAALLESILPKDLNLSVYHTSTPPEETEPLYLTPRGAKPAPTTLESHFLGLSLLPESVFVYGIEILIYISTHPTSGRKESTFFVSKADSSGYLPRRFASFTPASDPTSKVSTLKEITRTFLRYLIDTHLKKNPDIAKYTISLFARAQNQYLFPDSVSVPTKHILDDRQLIRWWCSVLDPLYQSPPTPSTSDKEVKAKAYLLVPGLEAIDVRSLLPPHSKYPTQYPDVKNKWAQGSPFTTTDKISVREVIPHFPDDPKARFMDELEFEGVPDGAWEDDPRVGQGWKKVTNVGVFWEFMSMRQECSAGRMVGFVWVVVEREGSDEAAEKVEDKEKEKETTVEKQQEDVPVKEGDTISKEKEEATEAEPSKEVKDSTTITEEPKAVPTTEEKKEAPTEPATSEPTNSITETEPAAEPAAEPEEEPTPTPAHGESLITSDAFSSLYDLLTDDKRTDFMNLTVATKSTKNWIKKVYSFSQPKESRIKTDPLHPPEKPHEAKVSTVDEEPAVCGEVPVEAAPTKPVKANLDTDKVVEAVKPTEDTFWDWGQPISGKVEVTTAPAATPAESQSAQAVNTINVLPVRKKRNASVDMGKQEVTVLGAGLVRKKPKVEEEKKD